MTYFDAIIMWGYAIDAMLKETPNMDASGLRGPKLYESMLKTPSVGVQVRLPRNRDVLVR